MKTRLLIILICGLGASCNEDVDRFERVVKIRGLGAKVDPVVPKFAQSETLKVSLTVYALAPKERTGIVFTPSEDEGFKRKDRLLKVTLKGDLKTEDLGALKLLKQDFEAESPKFFEGAIGPEEKFAPYRYQVSLKDDTGDTEDIVGNVLFYAPTDTTTFELPNVSLVKPEVTSQAAEEGELEASVTSGPNDSVRISWFLSGGQVVNRRAQKTRWEKATDGDLTVLVTGRSLKSGAFAEPQFRVLKKSQ